MLDIDSTSMKRPLSPRSYLGFGNPAAEDTPFPFNPYPPKVAVPADDRIFTARSLPQAPCEDYQGRRCSRTCLSFQGSCLISP